MEKQTNPPSGSTPKKTTLLISHSEAELKIREQINKGDELGHSVLTYNAGKAWNEFWPISVSMVNEAKRWHEYNIELLKRIFSTDEYSKEYQGIFPVSFSSDALNGKEYKREVSHLVDKLGTILPRLDIIPEISLSSPSSTSSSAISKKVFIVHGLDDAAKLTVARAIEKFGLEAVIIHEQPNQSRTIIEKFEANPDVEFAVVLLTPDDLGASKNDPGNLNPRARQNVILELGYFIGRLGRNHVCALHKGNVEIPTDFSGVLWVEMDQAGRWQFELAQEMKSVGFDVDLNKVFR